MISSAEDDDYPAVPRATSRVGADLRAARERLGWTLPAIAAHLRIRLPFLEAIEDGRIADLPGNAYAVGFIRTYGQSLGLDPDDVARRFKAEAADVNRKTELTFPAPVPERGVPAGAVVLVGAIIAVGAYIGWYRMSGSDRPSADIVQPVPDRLAPLAATAPATPAATAVGSAMAGSSTAGSSTAGSSMAGSAGTSGIQSADRSAAPLTTAAAPALSAEPAPPAVPAMTQMLGPPPPPSIAAQRGLSTTMPMVATLAASRASVASEPPVPMPPVPAQPAASAVAAAQVVPLPPGAPAGTRIVLRATADAWVQVRERQGEVLLNRVLRSGETWPVPPTKTPLLLTTGNAGGTELIVDGVVSAPLGGEGAVRRDMPLDPDQLREGKPLPQSAAQGRPGIGVTRTN